MDWSGVLRPLVHSKSRGKNVSNPPRDEDQGQLALQHGFDRESASLLTFFQLTTNIRTMNKTIMINPRIVRSYSVDPEIDEYVATTKGDRSASERVNVLLRRAMMLERDEKLEAEAAAFFASARGGNRKGTLDFQAAALRTFDRD